MRLTAVRCRIRPMDPRDIPHAMEIERQSFPTMWPQTIYQRELKNPMARYLVAYEVSNDHEPSARDETDRSGLLRRLLGGQPPAPARELVLGSVGVWFMIGEAHIVTIAVREDYRRCGIGELLLTAALEVAVEAQQEEVTLEYRISNGAARALYEKYGFAQVGVRARYYTDNHEDAVLMTTPPLRSAEFRRLMGRRIAEQRERWGEDHPFAGRSLKLAD
jgi:[ribosomal protein S18]-alanine N-acetyltransferase